MNYIKLHDFLIERAKFRTYDKTIHHKHHIIPRHEDKTSSEVALLTFKEHILIHHLRYKITGTIGNKLAYCMMKGILKIGTSKTASEMGKIGGKITRENKFGIFAPDYDRSAQSILNHKNGCHDYSNCVEMGKMGGKITREKNLGIFNPALQHLRMYWSKIGNDALKASGRRSGICGKSWREHNKELVFLNNSKGGKIGGKKVGSMYWWNDGTNNKKAYENPDESIWVRGMLMSEKKRIQFMTIANKPRKVKQWTI